MDTIVADTLVGRTVDRRYRVEARLAAGGMATVYRATDLRLDRIVALKVMRSNFAEDIEFVQRFQVEARSGARLSHPNVVAVYDQGEDDGLVYLAMEFVPGRTLREVLGECGPFAPEQAVAVINQALEALAASHAAGFVHRDIKPENVLITDSGTVKVTDFGLARALELPGPTTRGLLIGTAAYLAPEQVTDGAGDERTDVYQAGVLLYELLTGSAPHTGESAWAVAYQHVNADVPPVSHTRTGCPPALSQLVVDATRRDPQQRIPNVTEFLNRARGIAATLPPPQPFPTRHTVIVPETATALLDRELSATSETASLMGPPPPTSDATTDTRSKRPRRGLIAAAMISAVLAATAAAGWVASVNPFDRRDVPNVVGKAETRALSILSNAGFDPDITNREFSEEVPSGAVLGTDPEPNSGARLGSAVSVTLSRGPERYDVPNLRGKTPEAAAEMLERTNLAAGLERERYHDNVAEDLVIRSKPAKDTRVKPDRQINLIVSKGPAPVDVPYVVGTDESSAQSELRNAGLESTVSSRKSDDVARGIVLSVTPEPGTSVLRGDLVTVVVSEGPPMTQVPNVIDQSPQDATATLESAGFQVIVDEGALAPFGRVYSQDPAGGSSAPAGSTITLSVF